MLLRFRVGNHRSIRDVVELSLVSSSLTRLAPADDDWLAATTRVAGIYGANASGKSTVLDAINFLRSAVSLSASKWGDSDEFPHHPFLLDDRSINEVSLYEIDFVARDVRHTYGFESDRAGIEREWLYSYPARKKRVLFERGREPEKTFFGRSLPGENAVTSKLVRPNALLLSVAKNNNHKFLSSIYREIVYRLKYARITDDDRTYRIDWIIEHLQRDEELRKHAEALIRVADLGIVGIELSKEEVDPDIQKLLTRLAQIPDFKDLPDASDRVLKRLGRKIKLSHATGSAAGPKKFTLQQESAGTVAWLSLSVPALHALRYGETLLIDEVDASLHPVLTAELIRIFKDPKFNSGGGQLIFTTHDTSLLGRLMGDVLSRDEVWFTEKNSAGSTTLYSLEEFSVRGNENFEKRYLEGRYGALPVVRDDELRDILVHPSGHGW
jgi:predicted ATPase